MKPLAAFAAVLFFACHTFAASTGITLVQKPKPAPEAKPAEVAPAPAPAPAGKAPVKKVEKPQPVKEPVIPGTVIARPNGTYLSLEVVGGKFKLSFYDKKKKPMAVDVTGGLARWPNVRGPGDSRSPLNPSGTALIGARLAPPPYNYNVYITLLKGDGENAKAVESYTVMFRG